MLPNNNKNAPKNIFWILAFFGLFEAKKQPKLTKNEENWQNPNCLMTFSEFWYIDVSQQSKMLQKYFFWILVLFGLFLAKKQPELTKNEENRQNPNRLMKFSEFWYVEASQQNKMLKNYFFWISAFFGLFIAKKIQN